MLTKTVATIMLTMMLTAVATLAPALAARHHHAVAIKRAHKPKPTGACAQPNGRCISDCDALHWCQMNSCINGRSTPVPFWRCFEPSGLCFAPHC